MSPPLEVLSRELLERLGIEGQRPPTTPSTHLVGGLVKAGAKLEALLREVVKVAAETEKLPSEALLSSTGGRPLSLRKAMAGPLAHGLKAHFAGSSTARLPSAARSIVADLCGPHSRILAFISVRNEVAKEGREPRDAGAATTRLRELVQALRKTAGWT